MKKGEPMWAILSDLICPRRGFINGAVVALYHRSAWLCQVDKAPFLNNKNNAEPRLRMVFEK